MSFGYRVVLDNSSQCSTGGHTGRAAAAPLLPVPPGRARQAATAATHALTHSAQRLGRLACGWHPFRPTLRLFADPTNGSPSNHDAQAWHSSGSARPLRLCYLLTYLSPHPCCARLSAAGAPGRAAGRRSC